jgi:hypothetical protein
MRLFFKTMRQSLDSVAFWRTAAIGVLLLAVTERMWLVKALRIRPFIVASSPSGYHIPLVEEYQESKRLHVQQAELALQTLLNRGMSGVDSPDRLQAMFTQQGYSEAAEYLSQEGAEFMGKELSQKVEIARVEFLRTRNERIIVRARGQLKRLGKFKGMPFSEVLNFHAELEFVFNRDLLVNKKYPTLVHQLKIQTESSS